ncbi:MAG TPA: class I SAM-dependent methyltransferase [Candidatus Aminicenantes bacterium]|nr:class I SAM-dependent methyltransferase [Candidatus Aminicenantes bacterium]
MKIPLKSQELRQYWNISMERLPSYHEAPSTLIYRQEEINIIKKYLSPLEGKLFLKTDLWNEVKNTRILNWSMTQGASAFAFDVSDRVTQQARENLLEHVPSPCLCIADIRWLPYQDKSFDCLYSMGTAEHTPEYKLAFQELYRVLKPGGKAIIGVPNKFDPFLRPLLVWVLQKTKVYSFGYEKSFSRLELSALLSQVGFEILDHSSLLFMPGLLRMLDLFLYTRAPRLNFTTRWLVNLFHRLYTKYKFIQRHGYLLFLAVRRPLSSPSQKN